MAAQAEISSDQDVGTAKGHIIIAGTGRTGTTFLVQYLTELGVDTHISRYGSTQSDANAHAGLEDMPLLVPAEALPYVIKAPWIGEYIDEILASPHIRIDAAILPMRDLVEAASSRTVLELRALHQTAPWMAQLGRTWENWAVTPGGTIFSLNPMDQARILAVGFHRLIQRLVEAGIPIVFLAFPRLVEDCDYLFDHLKPILPDTVTPEQARAAHERTAQREKVRVGDELGGRARPDGTLSVVPSTLNYPGHDQMDRIALRREIARLTQERAQHETQYQETITDLGRREAETAEQAQALAAEIEAQRSRATEATKQAEEFAAELEAHRLRATEATKQAEELAAEFEAHRLRATEATKHAEEFAAELEAHRLRATEATKHAEEFAAELEAHRLRVTEATKQAEAFAIEIDALRHSRSWRATAWLRWLSTHAVPRARLARRRR